jgi:hypothetical protein
MTPYLLFPHPPKNWSPSRLGRMLVCVLVLFRRSLRGPWRAVFCQPGAKLFQRFRQSCVKLSRSGCVPAGPAQSSGHPRNASMQPDIALGYLRSSLKSWSYGSAMHSGAYWCAIPGHEKPVRDGRHVPIIETVPPVAGKSVCGNNCHMKTPPGQAFDVEGGSRHC